MVMREATVISERRTCQLVGLSRTVLHYETKAQPENEQLKARLVELASERRRFGYRRLHALVRREGVQANHKRVYRLYSDAGLSVRRRKRRHGVAVNALKPWNVPPGRTRSGPWTLSAMPWRMVVGSKAC